MLSTKAAPVLTCVLIRSHIPASISEGRRTAVSSDGGFSDLSEIPDLSLNSLDVILSKGTLDGAIIHSLGKDTANLTLVVYYYRVPSWTRHHHHPDRDADVRYPR